MFNGMVLFVVCGGAQAAEYSLLNCQQIVLREPIVFMRCHAYVSRHISGSCACESRQRMWLHTALSGILFQSNAPDLDSQ